MSSTSIFRALVVVLPCVAGVNAVAQTAPTTDMGQIKITDRRDDDTAERRESTVSKIVIGREEIEKQGDSNIGDVLRRQPGISIDGAPGRGSGVRMRGLSVGYTQILLDGQRVPPGFSIESLTPEMVERIEIYRAPTAETGTRAVAGTINIITREGHRSQPGDLKLGAAWQGGDLSPTMSMSKFHDHGDFTANYTLNVFRNEVPNWSDSSLQREGSGNSLSRDALSNSQSRREGFNSTARMQFKGDPGETFTLMPFFMYANVYSPGTINVTQTGTGSSPSGSDALTTLGEGHYWVARLNGQWKKRLDKDSNVEVKFNAGGWQSYNDSSQVADVGNILPSTNLINTIDDRSYNLNAKYSRILDGGHQWVSGSELEQVNRTETSLATPSYSGGSTNMSASSQRYAFYTQDEWQLNPHWATYAGLRYEHLLTDGNNGLTQAQNDSSVLSPLLHAMWRPDPDSKDQVRWSLTRSYKAPNMNTLMAPYIRSSADSTTSNGPTTPDSMGNPNLKPELATGMDLAFERYLPQGGVLSTSLFYRHIDNLTRSVVDLQTINGAQRWVSTPENIGSADTEGVELEAKFRLDQWISDAPKIDVRSNLSFYNSQVDGIVGPNNRLDQQPHMTGNLGLEYKVRQVPLTVGGNLNVTPAYYTQTSNAQLLSVSQKRVIDLYGLWKVDATTAWRLTLNNLDPLSYTTGNVYTATGVSDTSATVNRSYLNVQLRWEKKI